MRVNIYAEEMTERVEIISKEIEGQTFTGLRLYLELPCTVGGKQYQGPFMHHPGDDDSAAVTFWGKKDLRSVLRKMLAELDEHYGQHKWVRPVYQTYEQCSRCTLQRKAQPGESDREGEYVYRYSADAITHGWAEAAEGGPECTRVDK